MAGEVEDKVLESFLDRLAKTLDPVTCSTRLLEAEVIDEQAWDEARMRGVADYDRNLAVLKAVRKRVRADVAYFCKFCDVLEEEEYTKVLSKTIQGTTTPHANVQSKVLLALILPIFLTTNR